MKHVIFSYDLTTLHVISCFVFFYDASEVSGDVSGDSPVVGIFGDS